MNFKPKREKRIQEGYIHICIRGNRRHNVFYDNSDRYEFLSRLNWAANEHDAKIIEFALMDNHVHILASTNCLTKFVSSVLISYVKWYNLKYSTSGNLFQTPFLSVSKPKTEWVIETSMYILQNPVKAGICHHPSEFKWSSYRFHFKKYNSFSKHIKVDTSLTDSFFTTEKRFFRELGTRIIQRCELSEKGKPIKVKIPDQEVVSTTNKYLSDHHSSKKVNELNRLEKIELIKHLNFNTSATARQIASITQENYRWVLIHCKSNSEES